MPREQPKPVFDCSVHDFVTESLEEFRTHLTTVDHTVSGNTKCSICGGKCDNDDTESIKAHPGQAVAKCEKCLAEEEARVIKRLKEEGRTREVLDLES